MSYDLQVWSTGPVDLPASLPSSVQWSGSGGAWSTSGRGWGLSVGSSDRVLPEDVPEGVDQSLPGIAFLTELNLSPISVEGTGKKVLLRTALALARTAHGVVFDPQTETVTTAAGVKRLKALGASESATLVVLSWWFVSGPLLDGAMIDLVSVLESNLPEALPKRYGTYEPPQHLLEETGREHFSSFLQENPFVVWYPHAPVANVHLSIPPVLGGSRQGFRSGRLTIEIDADALFQPGWDLAVRRAWIAISRFVMPFYGDVRRLGGYTRLRGHYWASPSAESHPVCSWWWRGLPAAPVLAAVVGEPYSQLWPAFCQEADALDGLYFISTPDWRLHADALAGIGGPPRAAAQLEPEPQINCARSYPPAWPFGAPRTD